MLEENYGNNLWDLIVFVGSETSFKCIGSSKEQRCTISTKGNMFDFNRYKRELLRLLRTFLPMDKEDECHTKYLHAFDRLSGKGNFKMIGPFAAQLLLHSAGMIGLVPFRVATMAVANDGGPSKIFGTANAEMSPENAFERIFTSFNDIYGARFTRSYAENIACELKRICDRRTRALGTDAMYLDAYLNPPMNVQEMTSTKTDCIAMYEHRGINNCIQVLYRVVPQHGNRFGMEARKFSYDSESKEVSIGKTITLTCMDEDDMDELKSLYDY